MVSPAVVSEGQKAPSLPRLGYVDSLRALAAIYVVMHHAYLTVWAVDYNKFPSGTARWAAGWLAYGHFAVSLFIVISGFCLMLPVLKAGGALSGGARTFLKKRARRILPPLYAAIALSLALIWLWIGQRTGTHWDRSSQVRPTDIVANLGLVQNIFGGGRINHVLWSIAVECQIYLWFPLLVIAWRRVGPVWTALVVSLLAIAVYRVVGTSRLSGLTPQYYGLFALGMLAATISFSRQARWEAWRERVPWPWLAGWGAAGFVVFCCLCPRSSFGAWTFYLDLLVGFASFCLLVTASCGSRNRLRDALNWGPLAAVGGYSYSLYLIHAPLVQLIWQYALHPLGLGELPTLFWLVVAGTPAIIGAAYLFHLAFERPFMTKRRAAPAQAKGE